MTNDKKSLTTIIVISLSVLVVIFFVYAHNNSGKVGSALPNTQQSISDTTSTPTSPSSDKDSNGCYTPETVRKHYNETACIDFQVGYTHETSAGTKFIDEKVDYSSGFVGYIPYNSAAKDIDITSLEGKNVRVSGYIQEYSGYPEIIINDRSQVGVY